MTIISFSINNKINVAARAGIFLMLFVLVSCQVNKTVKQGITGTIYWFEGDLMPGIDKDPVKGIPISRELQVYQPTTSSDCTVHDGYFYRDVKTELVASVTSDDTGEFSLHLEPGIYTLLIKEEAGLFGNRMDEKGVINPVEVKPGRLTRIDLRVDYQAAY